MKARILSCILLLNLLHLPIFAYSLPKVLYTYSKYVSPGSADLIAGIQPNGSEISVWFRCDVSISGSVQTFRTTPQTYPLTSSPSIEITQTIAGLPVDSNYAYWVA